MANHQVMDYETIKNCFIGSFMHYKTKEIKNFIIGPYHNDYLALYDFIIQNERDGDYHISFNGLAFDAQITQFLISNYYNFSSASGEEIANDIYKFAQLVIDLKNRHEFLPYAPFELSIKQIDLYKLNHWDNANKRSSLKWIAYSLDTHNLMDMPHPHDKDVTSKSQVDELVEYCENDIKETHKILKYCWDDITLRSKLSKMFKINLMSASEPTISKSIFLDKLSKELKEPKSKLKNKRTYRSIIDVKDIILPYIKFENHLFTDILKKFNTVKIDPTNTKGAIKFEFEYKDCKTVFGLGGIHGANKSGIYESDDEYIILSVDVKSYYPNLGIVNNWSPGHIDASSFNRIFKWYYTERTKLPKSNPLNYTYKIILNSTYGLSNEINSPFYDPLYTMSITINGQLLILKLYDMIDSKLDDSIPLMQNTDGLEYKIKRSDVNKFMSICKEWEELTGLELEYDVYDTLFLSDVNSYIGVYKSKEVSLEEYCKLKVTNPEYIYYEKDHSFFVKKTKRKGRLEFLDIPLHKNKSYLIIRKAVYNYFIFNILPEETIRESRNIFDFCAGIKSKGDWRIYKYYLKDGVLQKDKLQKTVRYYNSKKGVKLYKFNELDKRKEVLESGPWHQTVYLKHKEKDWNDYNIDYRYYIVKSKEEIERIINSKKINQQKLFL